ncbi:glycosyltransferase [Pseudoalteromonas sp. 20-92]|uniref:glycosyltransferase n=1 Tax=unclassified Pseudoalteromonas TaxID=194690 RepID=UPI0002AAE593|nr:MULTISPECIES: glycosyltransferase [unclassified Pseudoalteromonas]ALQ09312.1 group 1 glycosyl transferase [Pseudoalteromonas sp. Bsw20308]MDQ2045221.1 glycosyltransferase [Pseudoalteromonas sp. 20-92]
MKILQVNKLYTPDIGGVETVCQQYSELYAKKHDVVVLCVHKKFKLLGDVSYINGVKVIRCSSLGMFFSMPVSLSFLYHFIIQFIKCDIAFIHLPFPLADVSWMFSSFVKRRVYLVWHSDIVKQGLFKKLLGPILRLSVRNANKILVTSPLMLDFSDSLSSVRHKCSVIPLSVDSSKIKQQANFKTNIEEVEHLTEIDGLFFGRLCYYKGVNVLLDSLVNGSKNGFTPKVVIAGRGEYAELITKTIITYNLTNVIFINRFLSEEEKYNLIKMSKCFLFPSIEVSEAFGITQLEAMCLGIPVINTDLASGVPWVSLHDETGLTVEPKNLVQFLDAFKLLLGNDILRKKFSESAIKRVATEFDDTIIIKKLNLLIEE